MNKSELVDYIANETSETKTTVNSVIDAFTGAVTQALKKGDKVSLVGFGTWESRRREATTGRNPRTGESIKIPASNQPKFKPGKALKDALNQNRIYNSIVQTDVDLPGSTTSKSWESNQKKAADFWQPFFLHHTKNKI